MRLVHGELDLHTGLVVLVLAPEAYLPLRQVGAQYHASAEGLAAAEEIFAVLETPVPATGTRRAAGRSGRHRARGGDGPLPGPGRAGAGRFSLGSRPGETVALVRAERLRASPRC